MTTYLRIEASLYEEVCMALAESALADRLYEEAQPILGSAALTKHDAERAAERLIFRDVLAAEDRADAVNDAILNFVPNPYAQNEMEDALLSHIETWVKSPKPCRPRPKRRTDRCQP